MLKQTKDELVAAIESAFANVPYPSGDVGQSHEAEAITKAFVGKTWRDVPLEMIFKFRVDLMYFTPEGFRYYLPAFMIATVRYPEEVDTLSTNLVVQLTPPNAFADRWKKSTIENMMRKFSTSANLFTANEIEAIISFLTYFAQANAGHYVISHLKLTDKAIAFWQSKLTTP